MQAAWEAWSQSSDRATELRTALQGAIEAGDNGEIARLKQGVGAVLAEHRSFTDEYKRLKAQRPDWKTPERTG
jgi:phage shock protein A